MKVWLVEGFNQENPKEVDVYANDTVRDFRDRIAGRMELDPDQAQVATSTKKLNQLDTKMSKLVKSGEKVYVLPRAKGG